MATIKTFEREGQFVIRADRPSLTGLLLTYRVDKNSNKATLTIINLPSSNAALYCLANWFELRKKLPF